jgi:hypothetical protein
MALGFMVSVANIFSVGMVLLPVIIMSVIRTGDGDVLADVTGGSIAENSSISRASKLNERRRSRKQSIGMFLITNT